MMNMEEPVEEVYLWGHLPSAIVGIAISTWWMNNALKSYIECKRFGQIKKYQSMPSYPGVPFFTNRYPNFHFEGWFGVTAFGINALAELFLGMSWRNHTPYLIGPMFLQHFVLLTGGVLRSCAVLLRYHKKWISVEMEFLAAALFLLLTIPLFLAHLPGKDRSDQLVHIFIAILCFVTARIILFEAKHRSSIMGTIGKCYTIALLSVWMAHAGDMLHATGDVKRMDPTVQLFYISMYFILDALIVAVIYVVLVARLYKADHNNNNNNNKFNFTVTPIKG